MTLRNLPIAAEMLGLIAAGPAEPVMVWDEINGRRTATDRQEKDDHTKDCDQDCMRHTGDPVWTVPLLPMAAEQKQIIAVRVPARQKPVVTELGPVAVDSLDVNNRVDRAGRLAQYWSAAAVRDAGNGNGQPARPGMPQPKGPDGGKGDKPADQGAAA